jgi:uncharacterized membrane protein
MEVIGVGINLNRVLREPVDIIAQNPQFFALPVIPAFFYLIGDLIGGSVGSAFSLLGMVLEAMTAGALVYMAHRLIRTGYTDYMDGIEVTKERPIDILIEALIIGVGAFIGFLLFVIPGLIWLMLVIFAIPILVIENKDAITAVKESINLVSEHSSDVLVYLILLVLIIFAVQWILGLIPYIGDFIATIVVLPYMAVSITMAYHELKGIEASEF